MSATPGAAASARPTTHTSLGVLAFDYPSDWTLTPVGNIQHYTIVAAFLTSPTSHAAESCGPDFVPGAGGCTDTYDVPAGAAVVRFSVHDGPPRPHGAKDVIAEDLAAGWQPRTVAGQPAAYMGDAGGAFGSSSETTLTWEIIAPGPDDQVSYEIQATIGPGASDLATAVEAIVASLRITSQTP